MEPEMNCDDELKALVAEEEGRLANDAADSSLKLLALLGAMTGEVTPEYKLEVARALVYVLMALSSVRYCIESATGELNNRQRLLFLSAIVSVAFRIPVDPLVECLLQEAKEAQRGEII